MGKRHVKSLEKICVLCKEKNIPLVLAERGYENMLSDEGEQNGNCGSSANILFYDEALATETDCETLDKIRGGHIDVDPLYVMFTSGSTGTPKGIAVSHRSVIDFIGEFVGLFGIDETDVIGNQAPFDFDVSVKDIYSTVAVGATMQIVPKKCFSFPMPLMDFLVERKVTTLIWAVSALCIISTYRGFSYKTPHDIKRVLFSGEAMPIKHLKIWQKALPETLFFNLYEPTEITCNCTYYVVPQGVFDKDVLPVGTPFPNEKVFLLNDNGEGLSAHDTVGEISVSGTALSLGYYNNRLETAKAFVQNPLNSSYNEVIYKTGDLGYYDNDGNLCFVGRKDFQIKHMGHRIELAEIETPAYVFDEEVLVERVRKVKEFFGKSVAVCFAIKANPFLVGVLKDVVDCFEVCSPGEFRICKRVGIAPEKIVLSGVYKKSRRHRAHCRYLRLSHYVHGGVAFASRVAVRFGG